MKKIISLCLWVLLVTHLSFAQSLTLDWAKKADYFLIETTKVDNAGNFYVIGQFRGVLDVDFGTNVYNLTTVTPTSDEYFITKIDPNGNFVWGKKLQGYCYSIAVDNDGNLYLPFTNGISKLDSNGTLVWHKNLTIEWDSLINIDSNNNLFVTGLFIGTVDFDPSDATQNLTSVGYDDIFVLKLDSNGTFGWVKQVKSNGQNWSNAIATDGSGNSYITGDYTASLAIETSSSNFQVPYDTATDWFPRYILKFDATGNFVWAKKIGGNFPNTLNSLAVDPNGSVYLSDVFFDTIDIDPGSGTQLISNLTGPTSNSSPFLVKLDTNGNFEWVNQSAGNSVIKTDSAGNIYAKGSSNLLQFPGDLKKYDPNGTFQWAYTNVPGKFLDIDNNGSLFISGNFNGTNDFDPSLSVFNLTTETPTPFVQKLNQSTLSNLPITATEGQIRVFPNPTTGEFRIETSCENCDYKLTDGSGKLLSGGMVTSLKPIDCTAYPIGLYFVTIHNNSFSKTFKLLKK
jgi:hypothetical protein